MAKALGIARPVVAITMGDPAGIGPEVILKALARPEVKRTCRPLVIGNLRVLESLLTRGKGCSLRLVPWRREQPLPRERDAVPVLSVLSLGPGDFRPGRPSRASGEAAYRSILAAVELIRSGIARAMATAPINKHTLQRAGYLYPGHTEILAELTQTRQCRMMLLGKRLKVILVTGHVPLALVPGELTRSRIRTTLELAHRSLQRYFGIQRPRLGVAGLNPHAGEEGILGTEERRVILPAIREARTKGIKAYGPFSGDSLFFRALQGEYDAVISMYHDQGLAPLKTIHFTDAVSFTLGLPIIRTSVDHGTAYELAQKNRADSSSMSEAILLASKLALQGEGHGS